MLIEESNLLSDDKKKYKNGISILEPKVLSDKYHNNTLKIIGESKKV
jgi:hypothetical protein